MTTSRSRKVRGAQTQALVSNYLAHHGWPYATDAGAGRPGSDVLGTLGLAWEVKARSDFRPIEWMRQADDPDAALSIVVFRPNGAGPASLADWPMILRFGPGVALLRQAGYGNPEGTAMRRLKLTDMPEPLGSWADMWAELAGFVDELTNDPSVENAADIKEFMRELESRRNRPILDWLRKAGAYGG